MNVRMQIEQRHWNEEKGDWVVTIHTVQTKNDGIFALNAYSNNVVINRVSYLPYVNKIRIYTEDRKK